MSDENKRAKARVDLVRMAFKAQDDRDENKELQIKLLLQDARPNQEPEEEPTE